VTRRGARPSRVAARPPRQPALGLLGLTFVVPMAVALSVGAGGEGSVRVFAPLVTYSLPLVVMVAFWWEDWPGTRAGPDWAGWADTVLIAAGAVVLTAAGQAVVGRLDVRGLFEPSPGPGSAPTFPATMPLGGTAFVAMLQLTLVGEGWPLRGLRPLIGGFLAVAVSWAVALAVLLTLVQGAPPSGSQAVPRLGPVPAAELGAALVLISAWQVLCYVVWRGWPFSTIANRAARLTCAHLTVIGGGLLTYVVVRALLGVDAVRTAAVAGCFVAAGLVTGMLFDGGLGDPKTRARLRVVLTTAALTAVLVLVLDAIARTLHFTEVRAGEWVEHAALDALATSVILHVAIGRRWPFVRPDVPAARP
jgi:hypothetical protein